ncbi:MAG: hypothetical protein H7A23_11025 [Leptospiraceae bacterium]|nr:hypothetical protein [Leptospiraceae bacterium]MCP5495078.1 hypothetical protein [Leptospiraceae bacterium]
MDIKEDELFELLKELSGVGVQFVICGGIACVLQGVERATYDLDIAISFEKQNLEKILQVAKKFDLNPRIPEPAESLLDERKREEWINTKGALVFTFVSGNSPLQIDIFLKYPKAFPELSKNADKIEIDGFTFYVSSKEDLLFVKKLINPPRPKDLQDIQELEQLLKTEEKHVS